MRTSAIGERREAGFTLIELLVVVAIAGLMASAVLLAAPDSRGSLAREAERLGARLIAAKEEAVLTGRTIEVRIAREGYGFEARRAGARVPLDSTPFRAVEWERDTTAIVEEAGGVSRISFDPTGLATPAAIDLYRDNSHVQVTVDAGGKVRIDARGR